MDDISYSRPDTLDEVQTAMAQPGARVLAGGTDIIVQLRERRRAASHLVDLKNVTELTGVKDGEGGRLIIGSAASASRLANDQRIAQRYPALATALAMTPDRRGSKGFGIR